MTIRRARTYDVPLLAELCSALGYAVTRQQIGARLAAIEALPAAVVLVAEDATGRVVGWLHAAEVACLTGDTHAQILGLVVAEGSRGNGVGTRLLEAAQAWARGHGHALVRVRSRIERERAHRFYERAGYVRSKVQNVFEKAPA